MNLYTTEQLRAWDKASVAQEPGGISALMERAAAAFTGAFADMFNDLNTPVEVFCGPGNNGGDGLAIARMLYQKGYSVRVWLALWNSRPSDGFQTQRARLPAHGGIDVATVDDALLPHLDRYMPRQAILIDALFGTGLSRPLDGPWALLIEQINQLAATVVAVDVPSGLPADSPPCGPCVRAAHTIAFERPKIGFLLPENEACVGQWKVVPIGLSSDVEQTLKTHLHMTDPGVARALYRPRSRFAHKGKGGHALIIAGAYGRMGAAVLAGKGALRAGAGLVTVNAPRVGVMVLQTAVPEAMCLADKGGKIWSSAPDTDAFDAVGVGPGIGNAKATADALKALLSNCRKPLVLDADALNILAGWENWPAILPKGSILTPHPGEFRRLFGPDPDTRTLLDRLPGLAAGLQCTIALKGANTAVALPDGHVWFNTTGNAAMATGGSGDVLTGIITALLAQGYPPEDAARLGVFLHGLAADEHLPHGCPGLIAGDLTENLGQAFGKLVK